MSEARCIDIESACVALNVSRATLYRMRAKNQIRIIKLLSKSVVPVADIDRLIPAYQAPVGVLVGDTKIPKIKKIVLSPGIGVK